MTSSLIIVRILVKEMIEYLSSKGFNPSETTGAMTDVDVQTVAVRFYEGDDISTFIVVTVGKEIVLIRLTYFNPKESKGPGIHTWVFVNGRLPEESFIQTLVTATEAKVKALYDYGAETNTHEKGTSKDSILIAASQRGTNIRDGEPMASLGKLVNIGVYECTMHAMKNSEWKDG